MARHCPYCSPLGRELTFPSSLCLLFFQEEMGQQRLCKSDQQAEVLYNNGMTNCLVRARFPLPQHTKRAGPVSLDLVRQYKIGYEIK